MPSLPRRWGQAPLPAGITPDDLARNPDHPLRGIWAAENRRRVLENQALDAQRERIESAAWDMLAFGRTYLSHYFEEEPADFHPQLLALLTNADPMEWFVTEPNPEHDPAAPTEPVYDPGVPGGDNVIDFVNHPLRIRRERRNVRGKEVAGDPSPKGGIVVAASRGHAKSTLLTLLIPIYCACYRLRRSILIVSDTDDQVRRFCDAIKKEFEENDLLRRDFGDLTGPRYKRSWTGSNFSICHASADGRGRTTIAHETQITGRSVGSRVRGIRNRQYRPDLILLDDIENDLNIASKEMRDQLYERVVSVYFPALDPKVGIMLFCGTIIHFDSVLARLLLDPEIAATYMTRRWAATVDGVPVTDDTAVPIWPARFTLDYLRLQRVKMRPGPFNREYMNDPIDPEARDFQPTWIRWFHADDLVMRRNGRLYWKNPADPDDDELDRLPYGRHRDTYWQELDIHQAVDPAISKKQEADYFTMGAAGCSKRTEDVVILWYHRERLDFAAQLRAIESMVATFPRTKTVAVDNTSYQDSLLQAAREKFRRRHGRARVPFRGLHQKSGQQTKETRLRRRAVEVEQGCLWLRYLKPGDEDYDQAPWDETHTVKIFANHYDLYQEMMQFPRGSHDDCLDCLDMLFAVMHRTRFFESFAERERVAMKGKRLPTSRSVASKLTPIHDDPNWVTDDDEQEAA